MERKQIKKLKKKEGDLQLTKLQENTNEKKKEKIRIQVRWVMHVSIVVNLPVGGKKQRKSTKLE